MARREEKVVNCLIEIFNYLVLCCYYMYRVLGLLQWVKAHSAFGANESR